MQKQQLPKVPRITKIPTLQDIKQVHKLISPWIHNTPVLSSQTIDDENECKIFFKCENFQKLGAFKIRGALSRVFSLSDEQRKKDIFTSSSGNFAQAVSYAGTLAGLKPLIAVPSVASQVKKDGVKRLGGILYECGPTQETRIQAEKDILEKEGRTYLSSYNDYNVIAGQGTTVKQLLDSYPDLDCIIAPVSGGGLMSGSCLVGHYLNPKIKMYAAQPELADDCYQSIKNDKLMLNKSSDTIAQGLRMNISPQTFQILRQHLQEVLVVSEEEIIQAMKLIYIRMKIVVETSSACTLGALLRNKEKFKGKKVGIVLTGGNVDLAKLPFK